jgi:hypothetical protein
LIRLFGASFMYLPKKWTALLLSTSQVNLLSMLCVSTAYNLVSCVSFQQQENVSKSKMLRIRPKGEHLDWIWQLSTFNEEEINGLPTYAKMLAFFGKPLPSSFDQLLSYIPIEVRFVYYPFKYFRCSCQNNEWSRLISIF